MTTPYTPDSPGFESLAALIPAQRTSSPVLHVPAQRTAPVVGVPPERQVLAPAPVVVGRDTRLAVLWTLLGATMGVLVLVAVALFLELM